MGGSSGMKLVPAKNAEDFDRITLEGLNRGAAADKQTKPEAFAEGGKNYATSSNLVYNVVRAACEPDNKQLDGTRKWLEGRKNPYTGFVMKGAEEHIRYLNENGFLTFEKNGERLYELEGESTKAYAALTMMVEWLGLPVAIEMFKRACDIATERGQGAENFYLYLDEVSFQFRDADGSKQKTTGRYVGEQIMRVFQQNGVEAGKKVTFEGMLADKLGEMDIVLEILKGETRLPGDKEDYLKEFEELRGRIAALKPGQGKELRELYDEFAYRWASVESQIEAGMKKAEAPEPKEAEMPKPVEAPLAAEAPKPVETGVLGQLSQFSRGKNNNPEELRAVLISADALADKEGWNLTAKGKECIGGISPAMIIGELKGGKIGGGGEKFLSRVAISLVQTKELDVLAPIEAGAGSEKYKLVQEAEGNLSGRGVARLDKMLRAERLFTEGKVEGKKGIEALVTAVYGPNAAVVTVPEAKPEEEAKPVPASAFRGREIKATPKASQLPAPVQTKSGMEEEPEEKAAPAQTKTVPASVKAETPAPAPTNEQQYDAKGALTYLQTTLEGGAPIAQRLQGDEYKNRQEERQAILSAIADYVNSIANDSERGAKEEALPAALKEILDNAKPQTDESPAGYWYGKLSGIDSSTIDDYVKKQMKQVR